MIEALAWPLVGLAAVCGAVFVALRVVPARDFTRRVYTLESQMHDVLPTLYRSRDRIDAIENQLLPLGPLTERLAEVKDLSDRLQMIENRLPRRTG